MPEGAWSNALISPGTASTNHYANCLETLQIQPSKVSLWCLIINKRFNQDLSSATYDFSDVVIFCGKMIFPIKKNNIVLYLQVKLGERFLQKNAYETMLRENIDSNIIFTLIK